MKTTKMKEKKASGSKTKPLKVKRTIKKAKVDKYSIACTPSFEVIDLSDSEESTNSSRQEKLIQGYKVNEKQNEQENSTSNFSLINQLLQLDGNIICEEINVQNNPNEIFLSEHFNVDETDNTVVDIEQANETEESDKFSGISKLVRARCSLCKINFENVDDNRLRYLRFCPKCHSPLLFQCRKCASFYKYFQSVWDHVERSCKKMEISPSIRELTLKTPTVITLDSGEEFSGDFVNCPSTLPFRIQSVESRCGTIHFSDEQTVTDDSNDDIAGTKSDLDASSRDIDIEENALSDYPSEAMEIEKNRFTSSFVPQNSEQEGVYYQCYKCQFKTESAKEVQRHIANVHRERFTRSGHVICSKCKRHFKSLDLKEQHKFQCCGRSDYKCKFCPQSAENLYAIKKHLVSRHSKLFQKQEYDGIITEIKCKRKAAKEMLEKAFEKKPNGEQAKSSEAVNSTPVSNCNRIVSQIEMNVNKKFNDYSKINELLKIRCCNCKVTFEKVEEKIINRCPNCQSQLLYSCRLCNKLFAFFDKAWWHVSYNCKSMKPPKKSKALEVPKRPTHDCSYCNYKGKHKWQLSQHIEMWHSTLNDDLDINFTACSRCGRAFDKPEDCMEHERLHCGNEMMLLCEFCPRVEARIEPMRIHLAKMHIHQLESLANLEKVIDAIKMKRQNTRGSRALAVPNQRDDFVETEEYTSINLKLKGCL